MILHTVQMAKWRIAAKRSIEVLNTTVKNGDVHFAPTWEIVLGVKSGSLSEHDYRVAYIALMSKSFKEHKAVWMELLAKEEVAISCFCPAGCFCHRLILKDLIEHLCKVFKIPFEYAGELVQ